MNTNPDAKTILCYGDSNTWGQRPGAAGRYTANVRWPGVLQEALGNEYYVIEEGMGGRTTDLDNPGRPGRNGRTYLEPYLDSHAPLDTVILMLGTNDLKIHFNRSTQEIATALRELVEQIQAKTKKDTGISAIVLLISPIMVDETAPNFLKLNADYFNHESVVKSERLASALETIAKSTGCTFLNAAEVAQAGEDGIHLDEQSHIALGNAIAEMVQGL